MRPSNGKQTVRNGKGQFVKGNPGGGRKAIPPDVKEMLAAASVDAAKLLVETMRNPEMRIDLRMDCAKEVLNRVYGKASQPIAGEVDNRVTFVLEGELEQYAQ